MNRKQLVEHIKKSIREACTAYDYPVEQLKFIKTQFKAEGLKLSYKIWMQIAKRLSNDDIESNLKQVGIMPN